MVKGKAYRMRQPGTGGLVSTLGSSIVHPKAFEFTKESNDESKSSQNETDIEAM